MDIAALNVRIRFQINETVVDKIRNHRNAWNDYYSCYATVSGEGGTAGAEATVGGAVGDHADICFTVRFCKKTKAVTSTGYRILFGGEIYNILAMDRLGFRKRAIKFRCEKVRR